MVLTLMEANELAYVGVAAAALSETFTEKGVSWLHLPIPNLDRRTIDLRQPGAIGSPG